jgi:hypothetical protein
MMGKMSIVMEKDQGWQSRSVLGTVRRWARSPAAQREISPLVVCLRTTLDHIPSALKEQGGLDPYIQLPEDSLMRSADSLDASSRILLWLRQSNLYAFFAS